MLRSSAVFLVVLLCLFIGACSSPEQAADSTQEKVFLFGNGAEPQGLDPHIITGSASFKICQSLFEGLVGLDTSTLQAVPALAERWEVSPDGLTYTFHLRPGLKWSNGEPLTAADFVYGWKRTLSPGLAAQYAYLLYPVVNAQAYHQGEIQDFTQVGVVAVDAQTLEVRLEHSLAHFILLLQMPCAYPVHQTTIEAHGAIAQRNTDWTRAANLVCNGAFRLEAWEPGQRIRVTPNPYYWDSQAVQLDAVEFLPIDNLQTEERLFRTGGLHKTQSLLPSKIDRYREAKDPRLHINPYLGTYYYKLNTTRRPFNNRLVRRAFAMSIDRDSIVQHVTRGGQTPAFALVPPDTGGYVPESSMPYNPEKARQLLAEAGYPGGEGFPPVELLYNTQEGHRRIAEAVQDMLRQELGVAVTLVNQDWKVVLSRLNQQDYDMVRSSWIGDYPEPSTFLDCMLSDSGNNNTGFASEEYDALLMQARREQDIEKRYALYQQAEAILVREAPFIPVYTYTNVFLLAPEVRNFPDNLLNHVSFKEVDLALPAGE